VLDTSRTAQALLYTMEGNGTAAGGWIALAALLQGGVSEESI
jgi:hypothetical protein